MKRTVPAAPRTQPLSAACKIENGKLTLTLPNGKTLTTAGEGTLLYRAYTDNDVNSRYQNTMQPYFEQTETLLSTEQIPNGITVVSEVANKKGKFTVTDTYEGVADGILVTSRLHPVAGGGVIPRFGKAFRLDESFDDVTYTGRTGESYCDMKKQFPVDTVTCKVKDMTEPNIKPQESGNRCDCTFAALSDGETSVTFSAVGKPFELGIKPYTDRALFAMKHRSDEKRTGTYVTIQAFQQGIGTGACGPGVMPEFQYPADRDYVLQFLIKTK